MPSTNTARRWTSLRALLDCLRPEWPLATAALGLLVLMTVFELWLPHLLARLVDQGIVAQDRGVVLSTALTMLGLAGLGALAAVANNACSVRVGEAVARDLRAALFAQVQRWSARNLDRHSVGTLLVRLSTDVAAVKGLAQISLRIGTRAPLLMAGSAYLMARTSSELMLTLLPLLLLAAGLIVVFVWRLEPLYRKGQERLELLTEVLRDSVAGVRLIRALGRESHERGRFEAASGGLMAALTRLGRVTSSMGPVLTLCVSLGLTVVTAAGGRRAIAGTLSLGQLVAFSNYLLTTLAPLAMMTMLSSLWAAGLASMARIREIVDSPPDVTDSIDARELPEEPPMTVSLQDVDFRYHPAAEELTLQGMSFVLPPGKVLGIVGPTGSGKSTVAALMVRAYDPEAGRVTIKDLDWRQLTRASVLRQVTLVPQQIALFSGTVRENIAWGKPDASLESVIEAARAAQAHEFIERLPERYDARIESGGVNLSGGQRQRLALARGLLLEPQLLILDDSTSALDGLTERRVQEAILAQRSRRCTVIISQRVSQVRDADEILVLDRGRIVGRGAHEALVHESPLYRELLTLQSSTLTFAEGRP